MSLFDLTRQQSQYSQPSGLFGLVQSPTLNLPPIPDIATPPTSYMNDTAFRDYVSAHQNAFNNADPNVSMNTHYANWLSNNNYIPNQAEKSFGEEFLTGIKNDFLKNPISTIGGLANGIFNLWQGFNQYRLQKDALAQAKDAYNFQKQLAQNAERRNQEQWDMVKRQRASSSL